MLEILQSGDSLSRGDAWNSWTLSIKCIPELDHLNYESLKMMKPQTHL